MVRPDGVEMTEGEARRIEELMTRRTGGIAAVCLDRLPYRELARGVGNQVGFAGGWGRNRLAEVALEHQSSAIDRGRSVGKVGGGHDGGLGDDARILRRVQSQPRGRD